MHPDDFKLAQGLAGLTNQETADKLGVAEVTIEKWRGGTRGIAPTMAEKFLEIVEEIIQERVTVFNAINRKYR